MSDALHKRIENLEGYVCLLTSTIATAFPTLPLYGLDERFFDSVEELQQEEARQKLGARTNMAEFLRRFRIHELPSELRPYDQFRRHAEHLHVTEKLNELLCTLYLRGECNKFPNTQTIVEATSTAINTFESNNDIIKENSVFRIPVQGDNSSTHYLTFHFNPRWNQHDIERIRLYSELNWEMRPVGYHDELGVLSPKSVVSGYRRLYKDVLGLPLPFDGYQTFSPLPVDNAVSLNENHQLNWTPDGETIILYKPYPGAVGPWKEIVVPHETGKLHEFAMFHPDHPLTQ